MVATFLLFLLRAIFGKTSAKMNVNGVIIRKKSTITPYLLLGDSRFIEEHK